MSILSVTEIWNGRRASASLDKSITREYTRVFRVITNDPKDESYVVGSATGLPILYDPYLGQNGIFDYNSRALRIEPRQSEDNPYIWEVVIEYGTTLQNLDPANYAVNENPMLRPPEIRWGSAKFQRPIEKDINNAAVVNSAEEKFDPPIEIDDARPILTVSRNELIYDATVAIAYHDSINSDTFVIQMPGSFLSVAPYQAKMDQITGDAAFEHNLFFWRVTYVVHFRRDGWLVKPLNQGYYEKSGSNKRLISDEFGAALSAPSMLDANGAKLALGGTPTYKTYHVYTELPFAPLQLP